MKRTRWARIGEEVKIIKPWVFERCGYPLDFTKVKYSYANEVDAFVKEMLKSIKMVQKGFDDQKTAKEQLLEEGQFYMTLTAPSSIEVDYDSKLWGYLEKAACAYIIKRENFGGSERQIFEREDQTIIGHVGKVTQKDFCATGRRINGHHYMDGPEWEPPYLDGMERHCIYHIEIPLLKRNVTIDALNCLRKPELLGV